MSEVIVTVLLIVLFFALISAVHSKTFAQNHPLMNAALKGFMFYSFFGAGCFIVEMIFPSFTSTGFLVGSLFGSVGGAVFACHALLKSQNRNTQNRNLELSESQLKTLPN